MSAECSPVAAAAAAAVPSRDGVPSARIIAIPRLPSAVSVFCSLFLRPLLSLCSPLSAARFCQQQCASSRSTRRPAPPISHIRSRLPQHSSLIRQCRARATLQRALPPILAEAEAEAVTRVLCPLPQRIRDGCLALT